MKYTVILDKENGGNSSKEFSQKENAIAYASHSASKPSVLWVTVIEETDETETEILSLEGLAN
jgi:hypothetical protein